MNKLLFFITTFLLFIYSSFGQPSENNSVNKNIWTTDYDEAVQLSIEENKPLLIYFTGSDWCIYCKRLKRDFLNSEKFKNRVGNDIVFYEANFPRNKGLVTSKQKKDNSFLKQKFQVRMYPTLVVVNPQQREIHRQTGYNLKGNTQVHYQFIDEVLVSENL